MTKKIIILNGSPRKNGNTSALTAQFKKGAEETGHVVTEFHLGSMKIGGCLGCWHGGKDTDSPCVQKDEYYWFISGQLKTTFDRLFAVAECDPNYRNPKKESVLIMAAEGAGFEESEHWYDHLEKHIGWKSLGKVLCGWVTQPGDIEGKPELQQAYELGKAIR